MVWSTALRTACILLGMTLGIAPALGGAIDVEITPDPGVEIVYFQAASADPDPSTPNLENGEPTSVDLSGVGEDAHFKIEVPADATILTVEMEGPSCGFFGCTFDADLYTRFGARATDASYDCRPYDSGSDETCTHNNPTAGWWYVRADSYAGVGSVTLTATHDGTTGGGGNQAPTASFTWSCTDLACSFDGSGSSDPDGDSLSYSWVFGDGATGSGPNPSHTYATAGTYTATLTVDDGNGATDSENHGVTVTAPSGGSGCTDDGDSAPELENGIGQVVTVNEGGWTTRKICVENVTTLTIDMEGVDTDCGLFCTFDADLYTRHGARPQTNSYDCRPYQGGADETCTHGDPADGWWYIRAYGYSGTGTVRLTATHDGAADEPNEAPNAVFSADCTGLTCDFSAASSSDSDGTITDYAWEFGDGATGSGVAPTHTYATSGTYLVRVTVTDDDGATDAASANIQVTAVNQAPTASFTESCTDLSCSFDGSGSTDSDGTVSSYAWDFGDGASGSGSTPSHAYATAGTYTVDLTVTDDDGATDSTSRSVTVTAPPSGPTPLSDGVAHSGTIQAAGQEDFYTITVPSGATHLEVVLDGPAGADFDLYTRHGAAPTDSTYDCRPYEGDADETCTHADPAAGTWHMRVDGYSGTGSYSITATVTEGTIENPTGVEWEWPMDGRISSIYWECRSSCARYHRGIDIANGCDTPIYAARAGTVDVRWDANGYGNYVVLSHDMGFLTYYAHMDSVSVSDGQNVAAGQLLGYEGTTGSSTGCHLHFEIRQTDNGPSYESDKQFVEIQESNDYNQIQQGTLIEWDMQLYEVTSTANVRDGPGMTLVSGQGNQILGTAAAGEQYVGFADWTGSNGNYVAIKWNGQTGWIHNSLLTPVSGDVAQVTASQLNVRTGAGSSNSDIGDVYGGQEYAIVDSASDGSATWYKIHYDNGGNQYGWIHSGYTTLLQYGTGSGGGGGGDSLQGYKIAVDPGHGGSDGGATYGGVEEGDINLDVALALQALLEAEGATVYMTRTTDVTVSLSDRTTGANNWGADYFLSIHSNSCGECGGHGTETYYHDSLSASSTSGQLAAAIQPELVQHGGLTDRGVKQANFHVLRETAMPAVLFELGFVDHAGDRAVLTDPAMQAEFAEGILDGLQAHLGV